MIRNIILTVAVALMFWGCSSDTEVRQRLDFNDDWKFQLGDVSGASSPDLDDNLWRSLELPHDWAVEGDFSADNPSGTGGGALPGGIGWYRKTFVPSASERDKVWRLEFDGAYMNTEVFVNGTSLGVRPYGYISFGYDIDSLLKWGEENVVAVRVDNAEQPNSRWYSGCGIYRNVWLVKTSKVRVAPEGTYVTSEVTEDAAVMNVEATVANASETSASVDVVNILVDASGRKVAEVKSALEVPAGGSAVADQMMMVDNPTLWDVENPYLYVVKTRIYDGAELVDEYETKTGFRTFEFDAEKGFILNGRKVVIKGVCMHHDLGCLGAAVNKHAIRRQLEILKGMGCNGIRTSHNPPAPELLDLCDEMGFIVQDEAFDMWRKGKTSHDYSRYFDEWHEKDLHDFVVRDRNHPSIFMWSIGNEVLEQWTDTHADTLSLAEANLILNFGHSADKLAKDGEMTVNSLLTAKLAGFVRELDDTRPITAGCNEPNPGNHLFRSGALDIIGYNYHNRDALSVPEKFPGMPFIITESNSALMTRGYYRMPSDELLQWPVRWDIPFFDESFACSSYGNCRAPWGDTHEETLILIRDNDYVSGQYSWTGFDYIGEPTPYGWPARSSYFGIVDLAGFPKDVYYLYQSEWTEEPVLHLFPHWNWEPGQEIDMLCYYNNADEIELFVNGASQGRSSKTADRLHAFWRVIHQPGEVEAVAYKDGEEVARQKIRTAGEPAQMRLTLDQYGTEAADDALGFVSVEILDADGNLCPNAENLVHFELDGDSAFIAGVDNGSPVSMERFKDNKRKAFYGKCLVVLQADEPGTVTLKATSEGLAPASLKFSTK